MGRGNMRNGEEFGLIYETEWRFEDNGEGNWFNKCYNMISNVCYVSYVCLWWIY